MTVSLFGAYPPPHSLSPLYYVGLPPSTVYDGHIKSNIYNDVPIDRPNSTNTSLADLRLRNEDWSGYQPLTWLASRSSSLTQALA